MELELCGEEHLDVLAGLNKQLIEDERHDNPMNVDQLKERMREWLRSDYAAYLFRSADSATIGYALVDRRRVPVYLRHFFICRESRRKGYGRSAFALLARHLGTDGIDVEVLSGNGRGRAFWQSLGFVERSVYLRWGQ